MSFTDPAVSVCFFVTIDGQEFGAFTSCDGLGMEVAIEKREEGGNNDFIHHLPGRVSYSNVKLTRPITTESALVARWMSAMSSDIMRHTATIVAMTLDGTPV